MSFMSAYVLAMLEQVLLEPHASRPRVTSVLQVATDGLFATRLCLHFISFRYLSHGFTSQAQVIRS